MYGERIETTYYGRMITVMYEFTGSQWLGQSGNTNKETNQNKRKLRHLPHNDPAALISKSNSLQGTHNQPSI